MLSSHHIEAIKPHKKTQKMNTENMTHEEIANEAIRIGRRDNNTDLIDLGRDLQSLVDAEEDSTAKAAEVIAAIRL